MYENIVSSLSAEPAPPIEFEATMQINGQAMLKLNANLDDNGLTLKTKKDTVTLPRKQWLSVDMTGKIVTLAVHGLAYFDWGKKRKFEKKNPGEEFTDFTPIATNYILIINQKRLITVSMEELKQAFERTFLLAYLEESENPASAHIIRCPGCSKMMDTTPYPETENIFCPDCSKVLNEIGQEGEIRHGVCTSCGFYTKLTEYKTAVEAIATTKIEKKKTCHPCRVKNTVKAFFITLLAVIGIGIINVITMLGGYYLPVLIIFGVVMFLVNIFTLGKVIIYSAARKATGASDIENAVAAVREGDTDKAFEIQSGMDGNMAESPGLLLNLIKGLIKKGDFEKALPMADTLIGKFPNFHFAYIEKLNILLKTNAPEKDQLQAEKDLGEVIARNNLQSPERLKLATAAVK